MDLPAAFFFIFSFFCFFQCLMPRPIFAHPKRPAGGGNPGKLVKNSFNKAVGGKGSFRLLPCCFREFSRISASGGPFWACKNGAGH